MALDSPIPDFTAAVRPVFFQTAFKEFRYATHGGTLFLVNFRGITYGITCGHVFQDFDRGQLFITQEKNAKKGSKPAPIAGIYYPSSPVDGAAGTDVQDICVIGFSSDIPADFFKGSVYPLDATTTRASQPGHRLLVAGVLKEKTSILPPDITIGYCRLEFQDAGYGSSDPILRTAVAEFAAPKFSDIAGVSGSPVFDLTVNALCGMVIRGGMQGRFCRIHYIDIYDILQFLDGVSSGAPNHSYKKILSL